MRRSTLKLAAVYASALTLCVTMRVIAQQSSLPTFSQAEQTTAEIEPVKQIAAADYDADEQMQAEQLAVIIQEPKTDDTLVKSLDWSSQDSDYLLKIAMAEAEGEDVEGKALVMLVVLNRTWSDEFPDSVQDVIFQEDQFAVMKNGGRYWTTEPDAECYAALTLISKGWDESDGALYFESCDGSSWQSRNAEYIFTHGNHRFYK